MKDFTIGILGGGQLARMLALAAHRLGIKSLCVDSGDNSPASYVTKTLTCPYDDIDKILNFLNSVDAVTYEFENIPHETLLELSKRFNVYPNVDALKVSQHRAREKNFCKKIGVPVVPFKEAKNLKDLMSQKDLFYPGILKTSEGGYDGKGQFKICSESDFQTIKEIPAEIELVLEDYITFDNEYSCIAVRSCDGEIRYYEISENTHADGILSQSISPPENIKNSISDEIKSYTRKIAEELDYTGIIAVEYFLSKDKIYFNEFAPRVHNTGHWTIDGSYTSQFENHIRACLNLPLGSTASLGVSAMYNLLGTRGDVLNLLSKEGVNYHWYGKNEIKPGRKVGHVSICEKTREKTLELLSYVKSNVN